MNPNYASINAAAEEKDPGSVLNYYKKMIALRKSHLGLVYGSSSCWRRTTPRSLPTGAPWPRPARTT